MKQRAGPPRYRAGQLREFASTLLEKAGLPEGMAATTAQVLLEADLLGFSTHGLMYLPPNMG